MMNRYPYRYEARVHLNAPVADVFAHLDDPRMLTGHMSESSWKMGGGSMQTQMDAGKGQKIGSVVTLTGCVLGMELVVSEAITERIPPNRKVWETFGIPRLLIIGNYRMGFDLKAEAGGTVLTIFIDYELPERGWPRLVGRLLGRAYAKWCTEQMVHDAKVHFR